jgi:alkanesulfonate monooxygenase SsuD/methylene tetrahydromethanopterin reductase-like flavin-dependent oxidoreductase (luciferase family)
MAIAHLAFLVPGNYAEDDPHAGLEQTLALFQFGEQLGFNGAWVRQRHFERGVSSATTFLAAASQRTRRIELGAAVIQMGYENPFRLAEDLATVDVLSRGRLQAGLSAGAPPHAALLGAHFLEGAPADQDFSHARVERLRAHLRSPLLGDEASLIESAGGRVRPRLQPIAAGLADRLWYGAGSRRSAEWAGRHGFNLLIGNVTSAEQTEQFLAEQQAQLALYRAQWHAARAARVALGRVLVPLDGADHGTRQRYLDYAAGRVARTLQPNGPRRTLFAPDLVGRADDIVERLQRDPVLAGVSELRLELPYGFAHHEYQQILADAAQRIAPALGWRPEATARAA